MRRLFSFPHRWTFLSFVSSAALLSVACSSNTKTPGDAGAGAGASGVDGNDSGNGDDSGSDGNGLDSGSSGGSGNGNGSGGGSNRPPDGAGGTTIGPGGPALGERSRANVLFSGHSLLDNPIPDFTQAIAEAKGDTMGWEQQNIIGSPIRVRTRGEGNSGWGGYSRGKNRSGENRNILNELANPTTIPSGQNYDTLLITERHDPLQTLAWENTDGYLLHYHNRLAEHSDEARTLLYQVWPDINKSNPGPWIDYQSTELVLWECIAGKLNLYLESAGREKSVAVIPGSVALARLVRAALDDQVPGVAGSQQQKLNALFSDDVHLTAIGQYFIAAVHYTAVFGKSPVGAHAGSSRGVSNETAAVLEDLAWQAVSAYFRDGEPLGRTMEDCRERVAEDVCPAFYSIRGRSPGSNECQTAYQTHFTLPDSSDFPPQ